MFVGTGINNSPTITGKAGAAIKDGAFLAAKFNDSGDLVLAEDGNHAVGLFISETPEEIKAGESLTVQVKDTGYWMVGAAVKKGAELASDATGKAMTAVAGKFILAVALNAAETANQIIQVQIIKAGYKA